MRSAELDGMESRRAGERLHRSANDAAVMEAASHDADPRWRELARQAPGVLLLLGRGGIVLDLSAPLCGRSEDFWRGRSLADALGPDDGRRIGRSLSLLERSDSAQELLVPVGGVRGEPRLYRFRLARAGAAASARGPAGRVEPNEGAAVSVFVTDVTEQVAEERLLAEREALLARRHKSAMLAYLAGGVAHDLNNLLTVIVGAADLLGEEPDEHDGEGLRAELTQIRRAGSRASEITRQLMAFSRREPTMPLVLSLDTVVRELAPLLARLLGPGIRLELSLPSEPWLVRLDPLHAEHVVTHLVLQARQAMPHGGVLWLSLVHRDVESFERHGGVMIGPGQYVELRLRDSGNGMSLAAMERAFEPFFAAEQMPGSTDLSLPLVRSLVVHAFGHIWLESEAGSGTVFHVLFPRYDERRSSAPPRHHPDASARSAPAPARRKPRRRRGS